jgi:hypothetical protein
MARHGRRNVSQRGNIDLASHHTSQSLLHNWGRSGGHPAKLGDHRVIFEGFVERMEEIRHLKWDLRDPWCLVHKELGGCGFMSDRVLRERSRASSSQGVHRSLQGQQATTRKLWKWNGAICQKAPKLKGRDCDVSWRGLACRSSGLEGWRGGCRQVVEHSDRSDNPLLPCLANSRINISSVGAGASPSIHVQP